MSRRIHLFALAMFVLGLTSTVARADQIITTDLYVTATSDVTLSAFSLDLALLPVGSPSSTPYFLTDQTDPYTNSSYIFYGQSSGGDVPVPFWGPPFQSPNLPPPSPYPAGEIVGGDSVDSSQLGYVTLTAGNTYFLGEVQYGIPAGAPSTDTFQVSLLTNSPNTYFQDQYTNPLNIVSYTYNSDLAGQVITISAVPEPASSTMLVISSTLCGVFWYRGYRRGSSE